MDIADAGNPGGGGVASSPPNIGHQLRILRTQIDHILATSRRPVGVPSELSPALAEGLLAARRTVAAMALRDKHFRPGLFVAPEWSMLLDLYIARILKSEISVSSLAIASQIPATTALRHIADLERHGEVHRIPDPFDKRRSFVMMSDSAFRRMTHCLLEMEAI